MLSTLISFPSLQSDFFLIYPNMMVVLTQMYSIAFCAAAPKCMLCVKFDLHRQEFAQRQNPKSHEIHNEGGLSDGCHNFRISILTVAGSRSRACVIQCANFRPVF